jgi:predicted RNase H-like nuclease (RuvC/YqgF family)
MKLGMTIIIAILLTNTLYGSIDGPETQQELKQKVKHQEDKIKELEAKLSEQHKQIEQLKVQLYQLKRKADIAKIRAGAAHAQRVIKKQEAEIAVYNIG